MIAGTGGPEEERLKESVPEYKEAEIEFLGYVSEEEKQRILRESYFFVYPSTSDTFGISVLEAMATGLPAVVTPGFPLLDFTGGSGGDCTILHTEPPETAGRIRRCWRTHPRTCSSRKEQGNSLRVTFPAKPT